MGVEALKTYESHQEFLVSWSRLADYFDILYASEDSARHKMVKRLIGEDPNGRTNNKYCTVLVVVV